MNVIAISILIKEAEVGDIVTFGSYEQDLEKDGKEPIEWIILERNASEAFLLSEYGLESMNYHDSILNTNWEKCSIRRWLNGSFFEEAFNNFEKENINSKTCIYCSTAYFKITKETHDKVILLESKEYLRYKDKFKEYIKCEPTNYVKSKSDVSIDGKDYYLWRLRAIGDSVADKDNIAVDENGDFEHYYYNAFYPDNVKNKGLIRPAIWVKFE